MMEFAFNMMNLMQTSRRAHAGAARPITETAETYLAVDLFGCGS